jgi:radical SAM-linked protein
MRFTSHRDFARALERAIVRARVPIAYSQGFTPHPKISYASAAPTGAASEAEYLELQVREVVDPAWLGVVLDAALPAGLDIVEVMDADDHPGLGLPDQLKAAVWRIELPGVGIDRVRQAVAAFLAAETILVTRVTKRGSRVLDPRAAVVRLAVVDPGHPAPCEVGDGRCAILDLVVRQGTPTVRPDDVLSGLRAVADLEPSDAPRATRLAQGMLTAAGEVIGPFAADCDMAEIGASSR